MERKSGKPKKSHPKHEVIKIIPEHFGKGSASGDGDCDFGCPTYAIGYGRGILPYCGECFDNTKKEGYGSGSAGIDSHDGYCGEGGGLYASRGDGYFRGGQQGVDTIGVHSNCTGGGGLDTKIGIDSDCTGDCSIPGVEV